MEMPILTPELLMRAYAMGVFPMAEDRENPELFWVDPRIRGIIPLSHFHIPRRLRRVLRSGKFSVTFNKNFEAVIEGCATVTTLRPRTWINDRIITLYMTLHHMGHAHSVECWLDDKLVGGLYGVSMHGVFFGESMYNQHVDASKVALVHLILRLRSAGFSLLDAQFITKHLSQFGAREISRDTYRKQLANALKIDVDFNTIIEQVNLEMLFRSST
jgi:leucyl/phenylalanyl-tRNA--protein transferase